MAGILQFLRRFPDEQACLHELAKLKWPKGFVCSKCEHDKGYHLKSRPRVHECAACGHQNSITAGTVFHKTRTDIQKWFVAAYMIASDKRGVSAMRVSKEFGIRYDTAWLMCHKIRAALFERTGFELQSFIEADETFYGGYREKGQRGRSMNPKKSMVVLAVEKRLITRKDGTKTWIAGNARAEVIERADAKTLGDFITGNVQKGTRILTDGWKGYTMLRTQGFKHVGLVSPGEVAVENLPFTHTMFSNIKAWLNGTHHGVSKKHLPRYLREWNYRFNRRNGDVVGWVLGRMATKPGITYEALTG